MAHLVLVTGLPGSGKSTFAQRAYPTYEQLETDQLFVKDGVYQFDPKMLSNYHSLVQLQTAQYLKEGKNVVVANTFSRLWEMNAYTNMPFTNLTVYYIEPPIVTWGSTEFVDIKLLAERNVHGVPFEVIHKMWKRWEHKEGEYVVSV